MKRLLEAFPIVLALACASAPRPPALVEVDRAMNDAQGAERARAVAPDVYAEAERYHAAAAKAFDDGDTEKTAYLTDLAATTLATAKERVRIADAEETVVAAQARTTAAVTARAKDDATLADVTDRVNRMERIAGLQQQQKLSTTDRDRLASEVATSKANVASMKPLAEVRALFQEADALPNMSARQDQRGIVVTLPELFATGKAEVLTDRSGVLRALADLARKYPDYSISVDGFTDSTGSNSTNLMLSSARATVVAQYLTDQEKLDAARVKSAGHGSSDPVALNSTAEGRAKNRRVEVVFVVQ